MDIKELKRDRATLRRRVTNMLNKEDAIACDYVRDVRQRLERLDNDIKFILLKDTEMTEVEWESELDKVEEYHCSLVTLEERFCIREIPQEVTQDSEQHVVKPHGLRLPKIEWIKFNGEIQTWIKFWAQFQKVHQDDCITNEDKYMYLLQATSGKAREFVERYPPHEDNYEKVLAQLQRRFAKPEALIDFYVKNLVNTVLKSKESSLSNTYDNMIANINCLECVGLSQEKYSCIILPLLESSLDGYLLREWEKIKQMKSQQVSDSNDNVSIINFQTSASITDFLEFLRAEVETNDKVSEPAVEQQMTGQDLHIRSKFSRDEVSKRSNVLKCIFCDKTHNSQDCFMAQDKSMDDIKKILNQKRCCYTCFKPGHPAKLCRAFVKCILCQKKHFTLLCPLRKNIDPVSKGKNEEIKDNNCLGTGSKQVFLQTLQLWLVGDRMKYKIRCLLDSGSSFSYVKKDVAQKLGLQAESSSKISHGLFGGTETKEINHNKYMVTIESMDGLQEDIEVFDQEKICGKITRLTNYEVMAELKNRGIVLSDSNGKEEIEMLLGANVWPKIITGGSVKLKTGLLGIETTLGWTVMGELGKNSRACSSLLNVDLQHLWDIETLGILDPTVQKKKEMEDHELLEKFDNSTVFEEGRYTCTLPVNEDITMLEDNFDVASRRLKYATSKYFKDESKWKEYDNVMNKWKEDGIIQETEMNREGHFLPHRPVYKENSNTTKVRPVMDASCKDKNGLCLNDCVCKGPNLIEQIPKLLLNFRIKPIGIVADIKQAFLQVSIHPEYRKYLKFLWWKDSSCDDLISYQFCRVPFGMKCSPFLLSATILKHLKSLEKEHEEVINILKHSFYVDNCVTSCDNINTLDRFIKDSLYIMALGGFELREWCHSHIDDHKNKIGCCMEEEISVLGIKWSPVSDSLHCEFKFKQSKEDRFTKRNVLSILQNLYDPIGWTSPIQIYPKKIMQETWCMKIGWDEYLPIEMNKKFLDWLEKLVHVKLCHIDRFCLIEDLDIAQSSVHIFVDGSKSAYATCIFVRACDKKGNIKVNLLFGKSRITPLKTMMIPRIELMAAVLGARMYRIIADNDIMSQMRTFFWSDSLVVLNWIKNQKQWNMFVKNRVSELNMLTNKDDWHHVPGTDNPADLLSRGCNGYQLKESQWWKGPDWLYKEEEKWPRTKNLTVNEATEEEEESKCCLNIEEDKSDTLLDKIIDCTSDFSEIIRVIRYLQVIFLKQPFKGEESLSRAEVLLLTWLQNEKFSKNTNFKNLNIIRDEKNLLRVKSRLTLTNEEEDYVYPILIPHDHEITYRLIKETHHSNKHPGVLTTMVILRKKYWILKCRKTVKKVIKGCVSCQRFNSRPIQTPAAPLPLFRLEAHSAFENCAVDCAGPLYTKEGKVWLLLFSCAVLRAVHLEVISSMSTESFLLGLRRMISRRGRMVRIVSDNGTNFVSASKQINSLDWEKITRETSLQKITFQFNPPASPWWGGFYERLIGVVKDILKKNLGHSFLSVEELNTLVIETESLVNLRPLTYFSEEDDFIPLTPALLLNNIYNAETYELDENDRESLVKRILYTQRLRDNLKSRFRQEYIGILMAQSEKKNQRKLKVNDIVLVGSDNLKRFNWPLGRIIEIHEGADKKERVAKVRVSGGILTRPFQRLYPLEINSDDPVIEYSTTKVSDRKMDTEEIQDLTVSHESEKVSHELDELDGVQEVSRPKSNDLSQNLKEISVDADSPKNVSRFGRKINKPRRLSF